MNFFFHRIFVCLIGRMVFYSCFLSCGAKQLEIIPELPKEGTHQKVSKGQRPAARDALKDGFDPWDGIRLITEPEERTQEVVFPWTRKKKTSQNGLKIYAYRDEQIEIAQYFLNIKAGRKHQPRELLGLADVAANTWVENAINISNHQIVETLDKHGGKLKIKVGFHTTEVQCHVLWPSRKICLEIFRALVGPKKINKSKIASEKKRLIYNYRQNRMNQKQVMKLWFRSAMWGGSDPRGRSTNFESLENIRGEDVQNWYRNYFTPNNSFLTITTSEAILKEADLVARYMVPWKRQKGGRIKSNPETTEEKKGIDVRIVDLPQAEETQIRVGSRTSFEDPLMACNSMVLSEMLGLIFEKNSWLRHSVQARKPWYQYKKKEAMIQDSFFVNATTSHASSLSMVQQILDAIGVLNKEKNIELIHQHLPRIKKKLVGRLAIVSSDPVLKMHSYNQFLGSANKEYDLNSLASAIPRVTPESLAKSMGKLLSADHLVVVLVGDGETLESYFSDAGWTYQRLAFDDELSQKQRVAHNKTTVESNDVPKKVKDILNRALEAKGKSVLFLKSLSWVGDASLENKQGKISAVIKKRIVGPSKIRLDMSIEEGMVEVSTVATANRAWAKQKNAEDNQVMDLPAAERKAMQAQLWRDPEWIMQKLHRSNYVYKLQGVERFKGKMSYVIEVKGEGHQVKLYIDKKNSLLNGARYVEKGQSATEIYGDYRAVQGVKIAHKREIHNVQSTLETTIKKIRVNKKISPLIFLKPPDKKANVKKTQKMEGTK